MWKCPKCKSDDLLVVFTSTAKLHQYGEDNFETEQVDWDDWNGDSAMTCRDCGFCAESKLFDEGEHGLTADELQTKYAAPSNWGRHPEHTRADWVADASNEETIQGYWDWVATQINREEED